MKKYIVIAVSLLIFILSSCRGSSVDEEILKNSDFFNVSAENGDNSALERYYGDFIPEEQYIPTETEDLSGIFSSIYTFNNNRFYFPVKKKYEGGTLVTGITILSSQYLLFAAQE
jgi:hypothetical protein